MTGILSRHSTTRSPLTLARRWNGTDRLVTAAVRAILTVVVVVALCSPAHAQAKAQVRVGQSVDLVANSPNEIKATGEGLKGKIAVRTTGTPPANWTLSYTPPDTTTDLTENVKYSVNGKDNTVAVSVIAGGPYEAAFKILFVIFVVALLLESGLAVLFNWQPVQQNFTGGTKTVVSVIVAYAFVALLDLDIVGRLVAVFSASAEPHDTGFFGSFITALIIAGGSSGVNNLMRSLGVRVAVTPEQMAPKPPLTEGWISVKLVRNAAVGPVNVLIGETPAAVGTISRSGISDFWRYFLRDPGRYPRSGGYAVPAGKQCTVELRGVDKDKKEVVASWGPLTIGPVAIIDLELTL
jgi:hypothetical protein